jgi:hypothetical protein
MTTLDYLRVFNRAIGRASAGLPAAVNLRLHEQWKLAAHYVRERKDREAIAAIEYGWEILCDCLAVRDALGEWYA